MPHARHTDPHTSHKAASEVKWVTEQQQIILNILSERPMSDEQICFEFIGQFVNGDGIWASQSGIRTRRSELVKMGKVVDSGERVKTRSNRDSIVWALAAPCEHPTSRRLECEDCLNNGEDCSEVVCTECGEAV